MITPSLRGLGFSDAHIAHMSGTSPISALSYRCSSPRHSLRSPAVQPLWECGTVVTYFTLDEETFEACSLETIDEKWFSHKSFQSALAQLFVDLYEDDVAESELLRLAEALNFKCIGMLLSEVCSPEQDYWPWRNALAQRCG